MNISRIDVYPLMLPMKQSIAISGGTVGDSQAGAPHVYVKITSDDGFEGWGEARPSHRWSYETLESVISTVRNYFKPALIGMCSGDIHAVQRVMDRQIAGSVHPGQPIAKAAVDMALHDLIGQREGKRLPELWMASFRNTIKLSYLISTSDPAEAAAKARTAVEEGFEGIDVKIGLEPSMDLLVLEAVKHEAPNLFFRVDANQAYDLNSAVKLARQMERLGVDVFEQPLHAGDLFGHAQLRRKTALPIALDESIWTARDVVQAVRAEACDTVVIKLTKMGGLQGAKQAGETALAAGLSLLGGGLTESGLALTASSHLFNYLVIKPPVDLNGPMFLSDDPLEVGPLLKHGTVTLPEGYGIGCTVSEEKLNSYTREG
ncbi:mandelate racemase [Cohnella kolymensis]|uniref:Mandelate racemase n=1 Tax=Cohnella kolymensis TaxID=1590652 RepID=A0ABR5A800_9BACL|nr:enolase C-terminal domain-like protein [Cohnella kolymensis]KIL36537.1 mandelate racemase [Cohnella kolymensis]